ncbi:MAG: uridine kinase [Cellvibrionaceae bacterium]|jgi:uridine kinase
MKPTVIGVAGGSGSGKTTIARKIVETVGRERVAWVQHDGYYRHRPELSFEQRSTQNYDHPNSLETELMVSHVSDLIKGMASAIPVYDFAKHLRSNEVKLLESAPIILLEGILIFSEPELLKLMDIKIFVDTDSDVRFIRRLQRDMDERGRIMESVVEQYMATVRPMHLQFVEPSKRKADVIIPEGGQNAVAMDMVVALLETI